MATATILPQPRFVAYDPATGDPLVGGLVHTYVPGGTVPATTWQDAGETTPNSNPIVLDSDGSCLLYGSGPYQLTTTDALGNAVPGYSGLSTDMLSLTDMRYLPLTGGTLSSPGTLTVDGVLTLNSTVDATAAGVFTSGAMHFNYQFLLNGYDPTAAYEDSHVGDQASQAITAGIHVPSSASIIEADAGFFGVKNDSAVTQAVAGAFYANSGADGSTTFAQNWVINDNGFAANLVGVEIDIGGSNSGSVLVPINFVTGYSGGAGAGSSIIQGEVLGGTGEPAGAFISSFDRFCTQFAFIGAQDTVANSDSQGLVFTVRDASNTTHLITVGAEHTSAGGNFIITTPAGALLVDSEAVFGGLTVNSEVGVDLPSAGTAIIFSNGGTIVGSIELGASTTTYHTSSDRRLKDIHGLSNGSLIDSIEVFTASMKSDSTHTQRSMVIADQVQQHAPWSVKGEKNAVFAEDVWDAAEKRLRHRKGDIKPQQVDLMSYIPDLIAKCQTLEKRLAAVEAAQKK